MKNNKKQIFLGKSDGITLVDHSNNVMLLAVSLAKSTNKQIGQFLLDAVRISSLLHDIGKATESFQLFLKKNKNLGNDIDEISTKIKFRHNEVGWAFLQKYLKISDPLLKTYVLYSVYWHHGVFKMNSHNSNQILNTLSENDINNMKEFLIDIIGEEYLCDEESTISLQTPLYYNKTTENNEDYKYQFVRSCLVSADRLVSTKTSEELKTFDIDSLISKPQYQINMPQTYNVKRFKEQMGIIDKIDGTTIVNAPTGFGKTMIGVLMHLLSGKKLIWVCPRNTVAESVYKSILIELKNLGYDKQINVELFLTNEVKKSDHYTTGFESDIIVTNIDNYLAPTIDSNSRIDRLFMIYNCDVLFDEYHEFQVPNALYAAFVNIMRYRHRLTDNKTLLLSATPTNTHYNWDNLNKTTIHLPNINEHYPAVHVKSYLLKIHNGDECLKVFKKGDYKNNLIIVNSVLKSQIYKFIYNIEILIHSYFLTSKKISIFNFLYKNFDKFSNNNVEKENVNVIGTHIIQASLDLSFQDLYESVISPLATLQRIGRVNRWGLNTINSVINVMHLNDKGENMVKNILYDKKLSDVWFNMLSDFDGKKLTLDQFYDIYNNFNIENEAQLKNYYNGLFIKSVENLSQIYPIKYPKAKVKTGIISAGSNKFRCNGLEIFIIAELFSKKGEYSDILNKRVYGDFEVEFGENLTSMGKIIKTMKTLVGDTRFNFGSIITNLKKTKIQDIRMASKKSDTPYIVLNKWYHDDYGLIGRDDYKLLSKKVVKPKK